MLEVQPVQEIIVYVIFESKRYWFISEKELWVLDYVKFCDAFGEGNRDFSSRFGIEILDKKSFESFRYHILKDEVTTLQLKDLIQRKAPLISWDESGHLFPALMVDFDEKRLFHVFSEYLHFEEFVPDHWEGHYDSFFHLVSEEDRYWRINGVDYLTQLLEDS
jgi:hypothetical protein